MFGFLGEGDGAGAEWGGDDQWLNEFGGAGEQAGRDALIFLIDARASMLVPLSDGTVPLAATIECAAATLSQKIIQSEADLVHRTLRGSPEVMVKVLSQGATDAKSVAKHFAYLSRRGELEIETDDGEPVQGKKAEKEVLEDWEIGTSGKRRYISLSRKSNNSLASVSMREKIPTTEAGRKSINHSAKPSASQVKPSWRALSTMTRRLSSKVYRASRCIDQRVKRTHRSSLALNTQQ